jgi:hypothetical protein
MVEDFELNPRREERTPEFGSLPERLIPFEA